MEESMVSAEFLKNPPERRSTPENTYTNASKSS
jgi:hypothetical protein